MDIELDGSCRHDNVLTVAHARGCVLSGLTPDTTYRIRIAAIGQFGQGPLSDVVELKTGTSASVAGVVPHFLRATSGETKLFGFCLGRSTFNDFHEQFGKRFE